MQPRGFKIMNDSDIEQMWHEAHVAITEATYAAFRRGTACTDAGANQAAQDEYMATQNLRELIDKLAAAAKVAD
jgi:hypothetical protein